MAQTSLLPIFTQQFFDSNGDPLDGGLLYFYEPGTTTAKAVYSDSTGTVVLTNPVVLDSAGRATIWLDGYYKVVLKDSLGNQISSVDNVSSQCNYSWEASQWSVQTGTFTYINATQFSVTGDLTATYHAGRRIQAVVSAGTITGTVTVSAYTTITTITVLWDSGSLDSGLSAVSLGIVTVTTSSMPIWPVTTKSANYTLAVTDINQTFHANSANAFTLTLPGANTVPTNSFYRIKSVNAGLVTISGSLEGDGSNTLSNVRLSRNDTLDIWTANETEGTPKVWRVGFQKTAFTYRSGANSTLPFGTAAAYAAISGVANMTSNSDEAEVVFPSGGILKSLHIKAANNTINANTSVTLHINGNATALTAEITSSSTSLHTNMANTVRVERGDVLLYKLISGGSSGEMEKLKIGMEALIY